jgi:outer membrane biosynthesis protein TonB
MLQLLLLQLAALSALTPAPDGKQGIISMDDYPAQAMNNGWQGDVSYDATVGTNGRITACKIVKSSGYAVLDDRTCKIVTE